MAVRKNINVEIKLDSPEEFFNRVIKLSTKIEVSQSCNELNDKFCERNLADTTISKYLTKYRREFLKLDGEKLSVENPDLYEIVNPKTGLKKQHCAVNMLALRSEQFTNINQQRELNSQINRGFHEDGELRDISNIPKINITEIIEKSLECLTSEDPTTIACGILNLTGLRAAEQNMPRHEHKEAGIIEHKMSVESEYEIGFRGVVKKRNADDSTAFYKRITLVKAQLIVDAQEKFLQFQKVQAIPTNVEKYEQSAFYQAVNDKYRELFGVALSTIKAYGEDNKLIKEKGNGTPRKARSFYACALRAILRLNTFGIQAITRVVQRSLVHDAESHTHGYLGSYDESLFVDPPSYIEVSTNINEYGIMKNSPAITVKETVKSFDILKFMDGIEDDENMKVLEFLKVGMSETQAVLELIKLIRNKKPSSKTAESTAETIGKSTAETIGESTVKTVDKLATDERSVTVKVKEIIAGIMHYNHQCTEEDFKKVVIPSHGYINTISKLMYGKTVAYSTVEQCFKDMFETLDKELKDLGIVEGKKDEKHNQKYHKKTQAELSAKIVEFI